MASRKAYLVLLLLALLLAPAAPYRAPRREAARQATRLFGVRVGPRGADVAAVPGPEQATTADGAVGRSRIARFGKRDVMRQMLSFVWPANEPQKKLLVVASLLCLLVGKWISVSVPLVLQSAIDSLNSGATAAENMQSFLSVATAPGAASLMLLYGASRSMATFFQEAKTTLFARVSQAAVRRFAATLFRHLHSLDTSFHLSHPTGTLSVAYVRGTRGFQSILFQLIFSVVPTLVELALSGTIMARTSGGSFTLVTFGMFAVYTLYTAKLTEWRVKIRRELVRVDGARNAYFVDSLMNHETVKLFGGEKGETTRYEDKFLRRIERVNVLNTFSVACLNVGQALVFSVGLTACMVMGVQGVQSGRMTVGDLVAVNALLLQLAIPFNFIGYTYQELRQGFVDLEYTLRILNTTPSISDPSMDVDGPVSTDVDHADGAHQSTTPVTRPLSGLIEFDRVSFSYPNNSGPTLTNVTLTVAPGERVAIVGPSGSGKSTLLKLITRLYDPVEGSVKIDGARVDEIPLELLRSAVGVVAQDNSLFDDTIGANIAYGFPDGSTRRFAGVRETDQPAVEAAAKQARVHDAILSKPDGYDTRVGERGAALSGGERQRVAIARAIFKEPDLLLCDEITSAVDSFTEADILKSLGEASKGRSTVTVAHRLASVKDSDRIYVLVRGVLKESGTHAELLRANGVYAQMWLAQTGQGTEESSAYQPGFASETL